MEALVALGLACNVVQLVDFASKAASECYEIYQNGRTVRHQDLATTSQELTLLSNRLQSSINAASTPKPLTKEEKELLDIAGKCHDQAKKLNDHLAKLSSSVKNKFFATFSTTLKSMRHAKSIREIKEHLAEYQQLLDTKLLASLYNQSKQVLENQQDQLLKLDAFQQAFVKQLGDGISTTNELIKAEVTGLKKHVADQNSQTKVLLGSLHEETRKQIVEGNSSTRNQMAAEHTKTRDHFRQTFENLKIDESTAKQKDQFKESLVFSEINRRQNQISDAYRGTFDWIFDISGEQVRPWDNYVEWLKTGDDVYWINGKAGSGKSTLMNFICNDPRTQEYLFEDESNEKADALLITFFFWNAGETLQKSAEGLLRSLLFQLLDKQKQLCNLLFERRPDLQTRNMRVIRWTSKELISLLTIAIELIRRPLCLFLDGLDEFAEDEDDLLDFVDKLRSLKTVKLCLSSRPSIRYETTFRNCKQLKLQDLTRASIKLYLDGQLLQSNNAKHLTQKNVDEAAKLILDKAQGVFLWVKLVIKFVQTGFRNRDPWDYILDRINSLPSEIEQIYEKMWKLYENNLKLYLKDAKLYFGLILQGEMSLLQLTLATHSDLRHKCLRDTTAVTLKDIVEHCEDTQTYVLVRCAGLLEVNEVGSASLHQSEPFLYSDRIDKVRSARNPSSEKVVAGIAHLHHKRSVQFFHRTARDFVLEVLSKGVDTTPTNLLELGSLFVESRCAIWCFDQKPRLAADQEWREFRSRVSSHKSDTYRGRSAMGIYSDYGYGEPSPPSKEHIAKIVPLIIKMEETVEKVKKKCSPGEIREVFTDTYIATDYLGLDIEDTRLEMDLLSMSKVRKLDEQYLSYLLACGVNRPYQNHSSKMVLMALEAGANPMMSPTRILEETGRPWAHLTPWYAFMISLWIRTFDDRSSMKHMPEIISWFLKRGADLTSTIPVIFKLGEDSSNMGFWNIHRPETFDRLIVKTNAATMLWFMFEREEWFMPLAKEYGIEAMDETFEVVIIYDCRGSFMRVSSKEDSEYLLELVYTLWVNREILPEYRNTFKDKLKDVEEGKLKPSYPEELKQILHRTLEVIKRCVPVGEIPISDWTTETSIMMMLQLGYKGQLFKYMINSYKMTPELLTALDLTEVVAAEESSPMVYWTI